MTTSIGNATLTKVAELASRVFLAALFLLSGVGKLGAYSTMAVYMASMAVQGNRGAPQHAQTETEH